jgi:hypothetical protein
MHELAGELSDGFLRQAPAAPELRTVGRVQRRAYCSALSLGPLIEQAFDLRERQQLHPVSREVVPDGHEATEQPRVQPRNVAEQPCIRPGNDEAECLGELAQGTADVVGCEVRVATLLAGHAASKSGAVYSGNYRPPKGAHQEKGRHGDDTEPDNAEQNPENDRRHRRQGNPATLEVSRRSRTSPRGGRVFAREEG